MRQSSGVTFFLIGFVYLQLSHCQRSNRTQCCRSSDVITDLHSRFINPSYPDPDSKTSSHGYKIQVQDGVCGIRLNYESFKLAGTNIGSTSCGQDMITVLVPRHPTQPNCGVMSGFTINYPVRPGDEVEVIIVVQSKSHTWNIVASQIPCNTIHSKPLQREGNYCGRRPQRFQNNHQEKEDEADILTSGYAPIINDPSIFRCPPGVSNLRCYLERLTSTGNGPKWVHNDRIVNGHPARRFSWPWQVVFLVKGKFLLCGGALISPDIAITAGHCLSFIQKSLTVADLVVGLGVHRLDVPSSGMVFRKCKSMVLHPQYADIHDDVSLCILEAPVTVSERIAPVCLPYDASDLFDGHEGHITGWGRTGEGAEPSVTLQEATIPIVDNAKCTSAWIEVMGSEFPDNFIEDSMICGGGNNRSTCNGDSGGPLTVLDNDRHILVGLTSFGPGEKCNVPGKPLSVFSRVSAQMRFISLAVANVPVDTDNIKTYTPC